jgi:hypothetical protein
MNRPSWLATAFLLLMLIGCGAEQGPPPPAPYPHNGSDTGTCDRKEGMLFGQPLYRSLNILRVDWQRSLRVGLEILSDFAWRQIDCSRFGHSP